MASRPRPDVLFRRNRVRNSCKPQIPIKLLIVQFSYVNIISISKNSSLSEKYEKKMSLHEAAQTSVFDKFAIFGLQAVKGKRVRWETEPSPTEATIKRRFYINERVVHLYFLYWPEVNAATLTLLVWRSECTKLDVDHLNGGISYTCVLLTWKYIRRSKGQGSIASKQASVLHKNDMKKLKNEMRWKMNKLYEMELI